MKNHNIKVECRAAADSAKHENNHDFVVSLDDATIDKLSRSVADRLLPLLFVCARVASRDTVRTPMRDLRAIFKDVVEEAKVARGFYDDTLK